MPVFLGVQKFSFEYLVAPNCIHYCDIGSVDVIDAGIFMLAAEQRNIVVIVLINISAINKSWQDLLERSVALTTNYLDT